MLGRQGPAFTAPAAPGAQQQQGAAGGPGLGGGAAAGGSAVPGAQQQGGVLMAPQAVGVAASTSPAAVPEPGSGVLVCWDHGPCMAGLVGGVRVGWGRARV